MSMIDNVRGKKNVDLYIGLQKRSLKTLHKYGKILFYLEKNRLKANAKFVRQGFRNNC